MIFDGGICNRIAQRETDQQTQAICKQISCWSNGNVWVMFRQCLSHASDHVPLISRIIFACNFEIFCMFRSFNSHKFIQSIPGAFEYEILDEPVAWSGARDHCQAIYNSDIATISTVDDFECALYRIEELSIIESAFILLSHGERLFYDNKPCPFEQGMVAYCPKLLLLPWKNTTPMDCSMDGSRCARIIPDKGVINNDISCEETLIAVLCNPEKAL
eukprot:107018_1